LTTLRGGFSIQPRFMPSRCLIPGIALFVAILASSSLTLHAGQARTASEGVYTDAQSRRGRELVNERCVVCHGADLQGQLAPPLSGDAFVNAWGNQPLLALVSKIQNTMPASEPGTLTRQQATDIVASVLQAGKFPAGRAELAVDDALLGQVFLAPAAAAPAGALVASHAPSYPPSANLAQLMRGVFFPSSNLIFNVQGHDPGAQKTGGAYEPPKDANFSWADWGAGIYSGWELVDYAAVSIADAAPLLLAPGRRCENGRPVPVEREDWVRYTTELVDAGRAAYKASQSRNQEAVSEVSNQLADACLNCHERYRDKPGGTTADPSNKAARCLPPAVTAAPAPR
jgi:mono/diheme cytochrome c family protein